MHVSKLVPLALACSALALPVVTLPWFGHISLDGIIVGCLEYIGGFAEERTVYQVLKDDTQYSRLVKAIDLSESVVDLLSDPTKSITFFAVPDSKIPHHHQPHHGHHRHNKSLFLADDPDDIDGPDLGDLVRQAEELEEEPDSRDKKKRKELLAHIVHTILAYHILPESYEAANLIQNSTYSTNLTLTDGSMDWEPLRLNVLGTSVPPRLRINMFVEVTKRDIQAKNGIIHQISRPLLPPPSIFQETFFLPEVFSFFTSAIQRAGLTNAIDRRKYFKDDGKEVGFLGATATTAFAPTSRAFRRLPRKLKSYLFSPFGQRALKKLLEYHIVPDFVLYTDYIHNSTSDNEELSHYLDVASGIQFPMPIPAPLDDDDGGSLIFRRNIGPLPELVYEYNATLPTLLEGHDLRVRIARYKSGLPLPGFSRYFTSFRVNGHYVVPFDIPARNGALHVLSTLLDPRKRCDHDNGKSDNDEAAWEDWEEWLPQWAMEN